MLVQAIGLAAGAPFVVLCGWTRSIPLLIFALTAWGFFKGIYDANIFASIFDVIPPEATGTRGRHDEHDGMAGRRHRPSSGGIVAQRSSLSAAIMLAASVYVLGALLLAVAVVRTKTS